MFNEKIGAHVYVISHRRPQNVSRVQTLVDGQLSWIVGDEKDKADYGENAIIGGKLTPSRNLALIRAFKDGKPCIQISDDPKKFKQVLFMEDGSKQVRDISFVEAAKLMLDRLKDSPFKLAGIAPTANPYFSNRSISTRHFVIGDFICVMPSEIRFDQAMTLKEDYDFTLQHIRNHGGVIRNDDILCEFEHYKNAGGAVSIRNTAEEQKNISHLKQKWGRVIADNAKRPNEILLKIPKSAF